MQQDDPQAKNNHQQWYFASKIVLIYCENSKQGKVSTYNFGTKLFSIFSWRFLRSNTLEQFKFKLEKIIGIQKPTVKFMIFFLITEGFI